HLERDQHRALPLPSADRLLGRHLRQRPDPLLGRLHGIPRRAPVPDHGLGQPVPDPRLVPELGTTHDAYPPAPQPAGEEPQSRSESISCGQATWSWAAQRGRPTRSEEHTSELQSLAYLVCRLLLEKKKTPSTAASASSSPTPRPACASRVCSTR